METLDRGKARLAYWEYRSRQHEDFQYFPSLYKRTQLMVAKKRRQFLKLLLNLDDHDPNNPASIRHSLTRLYAIHSPPSLHIYYSIAANVLNFCYYFYMEGVIFGHLLMLLPLK